MSLEKEKVISWLIPILIGVFLLGLLYVLGNRRQESSPLAVPEQEEESGPRKGFAEEELNPREKAALQGTTMEEALKTGDLNVCDKLIDREKIEQCYDSINYSNFLKSGDERNCEKLYSQTLRMECADKIYLAAAISALNNTLCENIQDPLYKQSCLDQIQSQLVRKATSPSECEQISNTRIKSECLDNVSFSVSIQKSDKAGCAQITNTILRGRCEEAVDTNRLAVEDSQSVTPPLLNTPSSKLAACESLTGTLAITCKDKANFDLALSEKDLSYCSNVSTSQKRDQCLKEQGDKINTFYFRRAPAIQDESLCDKITSSSLKQLCHDSF